MGTAAMTLLFALLTVAAQLAVVGLAGLAGLRNLRWHDRRAAAARPGDGSDATLAQTRPVQVTGSPLPAYTEGAQESAVGMAAPVLRGASFDGTPVTIGGDGKATLVVFLADWCPHCQRELPVLARWLEDGRLPSSVSLYLVSTAASRERANWPPSAWPPGATRTGAAPAARRPPIVTGVLQSPDGPVTTGPPVRGVR